MRYKAKDKANSKQVVFNCTENVYNILGEYCREYDISRSSLIRVLIDKHLKEIKDKKEIK